MGGTPYPPLYKKMLRLPFAEPGQNKGIPLLTIFIPPLIHFKTLMKLELLD